MILAIAITLFAIAFALVSLAQKKKAENKNSWIPLQWFGSGIGLVSFFVFFKLVAA